MTTSSGRPRHLASSPFKPQPAPVIEEYSVDDWVSHDSYGVGRVVSIDAGAVTVDFTNQTVRVASPYSRMEKL